MSALDFYIPFAPLEDDDLDNALQQAVAGITGLDPSLVRPRWQATIPKQPEPTVDWCSLGVIAYGGASYAAISHLFGDTLTAPAGDLLQWHEEFDVAVSFYGPHAKANLGILRDGLAILQNLEPLKSVGIYFKSIEGGRIAPDLINQQWVRRWDTEITFVRMVARVYGVDNVLNANVHVFDDTGHVDRTVVVPQP